jgi:hypothetical protein
MWAENNAAFVQKNRQEFESRKTKAAPSRRAA